MQYKIALIGCGRVGALLEEDPLRSKPASHMGGIKKIGHKVKFISICDSDNARLTHCKQKWDIPSSYSDYKKLFKVEKPDIAVIATWTSTHKDIVLNAVKNNVKGIVLEKPVASNFSLSRRVVDACRENNVKLVINHERRWDPLYRKTRDIVENKSLGALKLIYGNVLSQSVPRGPWQSVLDEFGGGPLLHDGTHLVDIVRYFGGDIAFVNGHVKREFPEAGTETTATALLRTTDGVDVFIEAGGMRDYFNFEIDLQFEKGRIKIGNGIKEYYETKSSSRYSGFHDLVKKEFPSFTRDSDPFSGAILEVMNALEKNIQPQSSGLDGLKTMEIIFAIYHSASLKGKQVELPFKINRHPLKKYFSELEK